MKPATAPLSDNSPQKTSAPAPSIAKTLAKYCAAVLGGYLIGESNLIAKAKEFISQLSKDSVRQPDTKKKEEV